MDALVEAALTAVSTAVRTAADVHSPNAKKIRIARAINSIDALKSALKAL